MMEKVLDCIKQLTINKKVLLSGGIALIVLAVSVLIIFSGSGQTTVDFETSLREIIATSDLRTAEYTYNSIAEVKDGETTKYYVSYKGSVSAGFDFSAVSIVREGDIIRIVVPDVQILEVIINPELDYMFLDNKYDTEQTYIEATEFCKKDLLVKATTNETLIATARESANDILKALIKPFETILDEGESFEIVFVAKEGSEQ